MTTLTEAESDTLRIAIAEGYYDHTADDRVVAQVVRIIDARLAKARRSRYCGCAWCCAGAPPEQRGEMHKRTCQPKPPPAEAAANDGGTS